MIADLETMRAIAEKHGILYWEVPEMATSKPTMTVRVENLGPVKEWMQKAQATMYEVAGEIGAVLESFEDDPLVKEHRDWFESMIERLEKVADECIRPKPAFPGNYPDTE